jgi:hypothetical protein
MHIYDLEKLMSKYRCTVESTRQLVTSSSLNDDSEAEYRNIST